MEVALGHGNKLNVMWIHHATPTWYKLGEDEMRAIQPVNAKIGKRELPRSAVSCIVFKNTKASFIGVSFTHPRDLLVFSPDRGRQQSLAKALKAAKVSRTARVKVWNIYFGVNKRQLIQRWCPTVPVHESYGCIGSKGDVK